MSWQKSSFSIIHVTAPSRISPATSAAASTALPAPAPACARCRPYHGHRPAAAGRPVHRTALRHPRRSRPLHRPDTRQPHPLRQHGGALKYFLDGTGAVAGRHRGKPAGVFTRPVRPMAGWNRRSGHGAALLHHGMLLVGSYRKRRWRPRAAGLALRRGHRTRPETHGNRRRRARITRHLGRRVASRPRLQGWGHERNRDDGAAPPSAWISLLGWRC